MAPANLLARYEAPDVADKESLKVVSAYTAVGDRRGDLDARYVFARCLRRIIGKQQFLRKFIEEIETVAANIKKSFCDRRAMILLS